MGSACFRRSDIRTVQALRALACLLVVAYHAVEAWGGGRLPPLAADAVWPNGAAGVDLFFVISGFVMALSSPGLSGAAGAARFMLRRLRRIVPLYWMMTGVKLALLLAVPACLPGVWHAVSAFLFIPSRDASGLVRPVLGVGWTLQFEMLFYGLFALTLLCRRPALPLVLPVLVPLALTGFFRRADWPAPFALANGLVLEFCLGLAVAGWFRRRLPPPSPLLGVCVLLLGLVLLLGVPAPGPWRFALWGGPACAMLAGAVALEPVLGRRVPGLALAVGEASYAIYLLHPFVVPLLARLLPFGPMMLVPASLVFSTLGGLALHRWVDAPIQAWLAARMRPAGARSLLAVAQFVEL